MPLKTLRGDITTLALDAIVNAANGGLRPGGGVCGAIHAAAGSDLATACAESVAERGPCPTGAARITPGFALPARWVIHAVGPLWRGGDAGEPALLAGCYRSAMTLLRAAGGRSIAFPAIATGIFGYPSATAASVAVETLRRDLATKGDLEVVLCLFDREMEAIYGRLLA